MYDLVVNKLFDVFLIGVDIESCYNKSAHLLMNKLLTSDERKRLGRISTISPEEETLLRFSFKESIYKAMHPYVLRPISFQEVEVDPQADGTAVLVFRLTSLEKFTYSAEWLMHDNKYWITCVRMQQLIT
jgi:4'-phosphopantetheinyl transferase EntD